MGIPRDLEKTLSLHYSVAIVCKDKRNQEHIDKEYHPTVVIGKDQFFYYLFVKFAQALINPLLDDRTDSWFV